MTQEPSTNTETPEEKQEKLISSLQIDDAHLKQQLQEIENVFIAKIDTLQHDLADLTSKYTLAVNQLEKEITAKRKAEEECDDVYDDLEQLQNHFQQLITLLQRSEIHNEKQQKHILYLSNVYNQLEKVSAAARYDHGKDSKFSSLNFPFLQLFVIYASICMVYNISFDTFFVFFYFIFIVVLSPDEDPVKPRGIPTPMSSRAKPNTNMEIEIPTNNLPTEQKMQVGPSPAKSDMDVTSLSPLNVSPVGKNDSLMTFSPIIRNTNNTSNLKPAAGLQKSRVSTTGSSMKSPTVPMSQSSSLSQLTSPISPDPLNENNTANQRTLPFN